MKKRRRARELALQGIYGWEISGNDLDVVLKGLSRNQMDDEDITTFASALLSKTIKNKEALDRDVASVVENWEFGRIALIDRVGLILVKIGNLLKGGGRGDIVEI